MSESYLKTQDSEFYENIFKDYKKSKEDLEEFMDILKKWAETQPHFPEKPNSRTLQFLILYNKFSIEKAKQKLDMYYSIRDVMPELYRKHPLSPEMIEQSKITYIVPLPKVTKDFGRIFYIRFNDTNFGPEDFNHEQFGAHYLNVVELLTAADNCYRFHCIFDLHNVNLKHIARTNPMIFKKTSIATEEVYSNRISTIHLVNFPSFLEQFLNNIIKPVLTKKMRERLMLFSSSDVLLKDFGKEYMPRDVGGDLPSLEELNELLLKKFEEHKDRFDQLQTLKVDESLRPAKLLNDDMLGYYGNFKKISID